MTKREKQLRDEAILYAQILASNSDVKDNFDYDCILESGVTPAGIQKFWDLQDQVYRLGLRTPGLSPCSWPEYWAEIESMIRNGDI